MSRSRLSQTERLALLLPVVVLAVTGCFGGEGYGGPVDGPAAPGGEGTVSDQDTGAFSQPAANLSEENQALFRIGDTVFTDPWSPAAEGQQDRDGLGPTFLATSCAGCHPADGRDMPPSSEGPSGTPIIRFVDKKGDPVALDAYGIQIQTQAVDGVPAEAAIGIEWIEQGDAYPDGTAFSLRWPSVTILSPFFGPLVASTSGIRLAPTLIGLGLLEAIPAPAIRANADPADDDGDGISGVVSEVHADGVSALGRFGLKANVATVADQVATAYLFDLGITSPPFPTENCPGPQDSCQQAPPGGSPEISAERLAAVVLYAQTLAVPARIGLDDTSVIAGEQLFDQLGCAACHTKRWETGAHEVESLSYQAIYPYTDMLLHDMGEGLSDGRRDGTAFPTEWRTSPLWGIGLARTVNPQAGFLHDGRARSIEEAILWHGGEAAGARDRFMSLSAADRTVLLLFIKSL